MNPEKGQHVKCFMRTGMALEGIVLEWADTQVVLQSIDGKSLMIVHRPVEDIMLTKVVLDEEPDEISEEKPSPTQMQESIKKKLHEAQAYSEDEDLQRKSIEELRKLVIAQDKHIIADKTKEHFGSAGAGKTTQYSSIFGPMKHRIIGPLKPIKKPY
jgi:hypothetical protein